MAIDISYTVQRFYRQYSQLETLLDFPEGTLLRESQVQQYLYEHLFDPEKQSGIAVPASYALRTLKRLVEIIEQSIDDWNLYGVSDKLAVHLGEIASGNTLCTGVSGGDGRVKKHIVTYTLASIQGEQPLPISPPVIKLLENRSTVSAGGTTGLRTWEAALHLGEYLRRNRSLVEGKRILELGAGTGYVSILCAKYLKAFQCIASDGSSSIIDSMPENLRLNGLSSMALVIPRVLWWGDKECGGVFHAEGDAGQRVNIDESRREDRGFDLVLGADITFDERDMPDLLATVHECVDSHPSTVVLIATTERNRITFETFMRLAEADFSVSFVVFPVPKRADQSGPFYSDALPIHICQLVLNRTKT